jgi:hypothetical protein
VRRLLALLTVISALVVLARAPSGVGTPHPFAHHPPHLQGAALLTDAGGQLWWVTRQCGAVRFDMVRHGVQEARGRYCQVWPSPSGSIALASDSTGPPPGPPGRLVVLSGRTMRQVALTPLRGDQIVPPVRWSASGNLALACISERSARTTIELLEKPWTTVVALANRCTPALTDAQTLLASSGDAVYENGQDIGISNLLDRGPRGGHVTVTALAPTPHGVAVATTGPHGSQIVLIDRESGAVRRVPTETSATEISVSPDGEELWYRRGTTGEEMLVELGEPAGIGVPVIADAFAWSPSGRYIAAASGGSIRVFDRSDGSVATINAGPLASLAWTR